jgi:hypothetical protein
MYKEKEHIESSRTNSGTSVQTGGWQPPSSQNRGQLPVYTEKASKSGNCPRFYHTNSNTSVQTGRWLVRLGLWELICGMMILSQEYGLPWMASWQRHLDNPDWLGRAMAMTFMQLKPVDKDLIGTKYDDWLWFEKNVDMQALVEPEYNALCYLLDKDGKRIGRPDGPVTVLRGLKGQDKQEALQTLDRQRYEFKAWW